MESWDIFSIILRYTVVKESLVLVVTAICQRLGAFNESLNPGVPASFVKRNRDKRIKSHHKKNSVL